jgi:hypothetical protein
MRRANFVAGLILAVAIAVPGWALDDVKIPVNLEKLAAHATESVDVTLDASIGE